MYYIYVWPESDWKRGNNLFSGEYVKVKQLITQLLKYNPNAEIRYLTYGCVGNKIGIQYTDMCVYICDAEDKSARLSNPTESPVLAK